MVSYGAHLKGTLKGTQGKGVPRGRPVPMYCVLFYYSAELADELRQRKAVRLRARPACASSARQLSRISIKDHSHLGPQSLCGARSWLHAVVPLHSQSAHSNPRSSFTAASPDLVTSTHVQHPRFPTRRAVLIRSASSAVRRAARPTTTKGGAHDAHNAAHRAA